MGVIVRWVDWKLSWSDFRVALCKNGVVPTWWRSNIFSRCEEIVSKSVPKANGSGKQRWNGRWGPNLGRSFCCQGPTSAKRELNQTHLPVIRNRSTTYTQARSNKVFWISTPYTRIQRLEIQLFWNKTRAVQLVTDYLPDRPSDIHLACLKDPSLVTNFIFQLMNRETPEKQEPMAAKASQKISHP